MDQALARGENPAAALKLLHVTRNTLHVFAVVPDPGGLCKLAGTAAGSGEARAKPYVKRVTCYVKLRYNRQLLDS